MNSNFRQDPRAAAWEVLIRMDVRELPVRPARICKAKGVKIRYCMLTGQNKGAAFILKGTPVILIAESEYVWQKRFVAAHELGHIVLGHVGERWEPSYDIPIENAANAFAAELLAPACVLHELGLFDAGQIAEVCQISRTAAGYRLRRLLLLEERGRYYLSPLERRVRDQFAEFIRYYKSSG